MKQLLLFSILLLSASSFALAQPKVVIAGKINAPKAPTIQVEIITNPLGNQGFRFVDTLDADGQFNIQFKLGQPILAYLVQGKAAIAELFIQPEDSIFATIQNNKLSTTIYSGKGAKEATALQQFNRQFGMMGKRNHPKNVIKILSTAEYRVYADSIRQLQKDFFINFQPKNGKIGELSTNFTDFMTYMVDCEWGLSLLNYPFLHRRFKRLDRLPPFAADYNQVVKQIELQKPEYLYATSYIQFIDGYTSALTLQKHKTTVNKGTYDYSTLYAEKYDLAKSLFEGPIRYFLMTKSLVEGYENGKVALAAAKYEDFMAENPNVQQKKIVEQVHHQWKSFSPEQAAPDFTLTDVEGNQVSLSDYKGKVVYLDFWATWCGPCKREIPHAKKLKKHFKGQDVVFMYVSTDRKESSWRNFVEKDEEFKQGVHLFADKSALTVKQNYRIKGIPSFFLIDKAGKMADNKAQRPSSKGIIADIERLLAE